MKHVLNQRVGLALSGGAVRGLAHIGVLKALAEMGITPVVIAGTSVGSLIGAALAAGKDWQGIAEMAASVFWPSLLERDNLENFCREHLPATFAGLQLPFTAVTTALPSRQTVKITQGCLPSAISASCALPFVRRPVEREGHVLEDGGTTCVLPTEICREMGADFVIASDVWGYAWCLRVIGCDPDHPLSGQAYPEHYRRALGQTDILIRPSIPVDAYVPGDRAVERMIEVGETATQHAFSQLLLASA